MPIHIYKPTSPARRQTSIVKGDTAKVEPRRSLIESKKKFSGRNNQGKITVRHRGGGVKRFYRLVDFHGNKFDVVGKVVNIEYDPNRSTRIALVQYPDGEVRYMLAPEGLQAGAEVLSSQKRIDIKLGNRLPLEFIPTGVLVSNVELHPQSGGKLARSAGSSATIMALEGGVVTLRLGSGEIRQVDKRCMATIGQSGNVEFRNQRIGKAGRKRRLGWRPTVRGKVMNPVDHPHGGGEGNQPIGLTGPKTPWGKPALGVPTRKRNKYSRRHIVRARKIRV